MLKKVTWSAKAVRQFNEAIGYIRQNSLQNADKVKKDILARVERLSKGNIIHRKDPYKKGNDGTFHYFIAMNYRISYCETDAEIIIIRVRHESMEPKIY